MSSFANGNGLIFSSNYFRTETWEIHKAVHNKEEKNEQAEVCIANLNDANVRS